MAPEILFKRDYSYDSDFYALGVIIFELAMGRRPFEGKNRAEIREEILKRDVQLTPDDLPFGWSPLLADLINQLLKKNPLERLGHGGVQEIKSHRYFAEVKWKRLERKEIKPPYIPSVICEMKEYLDEISLFNQMNEQNSQENIFAVDRETNERFKEYDYDRGSPGKEKIQKVLKSNLKKNKRMSQRKILA
jgi:serine/threonine protein kinase